jgi:hypothetical protein
VDDKVENEMIYVSLRERIRAVHMVWSLNGGHRENRRSDERSGGDEQRRCGQFVALGARDVWEKYLGHSVPSRRQCHSGAS